MSDFPKVLPLTAWVGLKTMMWDSQSSFFPNCHLEIGGNFNSEGANVKYFIKESGRNSQKTSMFDEGRLYI